MGEQYLTVHSHCFCFVALLSFVGFLERLVLLIRAPIAIGAGSSPGGGAYSSNARNSVGGQCLTVHSHCFSHLHF